jgi:CelD/BcsL family acetyltransferase involved in cellulose biosynthesis
MQTSIAIKVESDAWALLSDQRFLFRWQELYEACAWATSFQSPGFVCTWFENYKCQFSPVIIYQGTDERLTGLLILGQSVATHKLVVAGGHQAEYQTWLEYPDQKDDFICQALKAFATTLPGYTLAFKYLPQEAPVKRFARSEKLNRRTVVMARPRLFTSINQDSINQIVSNKRNQRSLKQLNKLGELEFMRIFDIGMFASIFDEISAFYDFRQGAVHNRFHFLRDASKKPFHLDLLAKNPDLAHVTITTLNGKILAAHIGILSKNQIHLGIIAYSPFYAHYSPGIVHLMLLCQLLYQEGIALFDLTPGSDPAKERFANGCDQVYQVTLYRDWKARFIALLKAKGIIFVKYLSRSMGLSHDKARALFEGAKRTNIKSTSRKLLGIFWRKSEVRVYRYNSERSISTSGRGSLNKDILKDPIKFEPTDSLVSKQDFMSEAMNRLARSEHFYSYVTADRLIFCCWLSTLQNERFNTEVQQSIRFQDHCTVLENFYYDPRSIGTEQFQDLVRLALYDISKSNHDTQIMIFIPGQDDLVIHAIESLELNYVGSMHLQRIFGITRRWTSNHRTQTKWLIRPFTRGI